MRGNERIKRTQNFGITSTKEKKGKLAVYFISNEWGKGFFRPRC